LEEGRFQPPVGEGKKGKRPNLRERLRIFHREGGAAFHATKEGGGGKEGGGEQPGRNQKVQLLLPQGGGEKCVFSLGGRGKRRTSLAAFRRRQGL